ncbi:MAG: hypothetical protein GEV10_20280 [Streptosporangiales bacterium]|nr:hypothetical protein [Streptosporangiales bacterium]
MSITVRPGELTAIGAAARDVGGSTLPSATSALNRGKADVGDARLSGLQSRAALSSSLAMWVVIGKGLATDTVSTGSKIVRTSDAAVRGDDDSASLFTKVPVFGSRPGF